MSKHIQTKENQLGENMSEIKRNSKQYEKNKTANNRCPKNKKDKTVSGNTQ